MEDEMPLGPLVVSFDLQGLTCHDKGQDPGPRAEPYLWVIYFTVDGTTVQLSDPDFTLHGVARAVPTPGSHGDLGVVEVSSGQVVPIPQALGAFNTTLIPIPVSQQLQNLGAPAQVAGVAGAVCVLMEQDWTNDSAAEAGHQALNDGFRTHLNKLVDELGALHPQPTPADVDTISLKIQQAVKDAIAQ
jgi:hypothetical protein